MLILLTPFLCALAPCNTFIGEQIFLNECSAQKEKLVWWNRGEEFPSLGIGHFIWYPEGVQGPFEETFPLLLKFLQEKRVTLPCGFDPTKGAPWRTREQLFEAPERAQLQEFLFETRALQAEFIQQRLQPVLEAILASEEEGHKELILNRLQKLQLSSEGTFALIDYLHFKGSGLSLQERYQGQGWGLKQVLEQMQDASLTAFVQAAKTVLTQRVEHSPPERQEKQWLPGWMARIERYQNCLLTSSKI